MASLQVLSELFGLLIFAFKKKKNLWKAVNSIIIEGAEGGLEL